MLHVRGSEGTDDSLAAFITATLDGLVPAEAVRRIAPSLEDVFVLHGDSAIEVAA